MFQENPRNIRFAIVIVVILLLVAIGYGVYIALDRKDKVAVEIVAVPSDMKLLLNNKEVGRGTVYLKPGYYNLNASKEGFESRSGTTQISKEDHTITTALVPESAEAKKWAADNQDAYHELEAVSGQASVDKGDIFRSKNPIVRNLPDDSLLFKIGYRADPSDPSGNSIILEIDAPDGNRQAAIYQISQWGFDPSDFKINFKDYKNPFTS